MKPSPLRLSEITALSDRNGGKGTFNVLGLPIERQKELAELEGMPFDQWLKKTKQEFDEWHTYLDSIKVLTFKSQEEAERAGYNLDKWREPLVPFFHGD